MGQPKYDFPKSERLRGKKKIEELFKRGSSFYLDSFQVRYHKGSESDSVQVLISVPKRNFKRAVDRNLLKRRIREAYRTNKHLLSDLQDSKQSAIAFIYVGKQILTFSEIEAQLIKCLHRLHTSLKSNPAC